MIRTTTSALPFLAAITLLGLTTAYGAEELWVIKNGVLNRKALARSVEDSGYCTGRTIDGFHVTGPETLSRLTTGKSALGDCELKVVFKASSARRKWRFPAIQISDRGALCFWKTGSPIILSVSKRALPLKGFDLATEKNPFDGNLHSMAVKRVGNRISFYYDNKKLNEQPIDPDVRLHLWFDALFCTSRIKTIKLTAEKFSGNLTTDFKSAAPIAEIFKGSGPRKTPEYGKACRYRIPALAVSKKGTILAFAEARRTGGADVGDIDAVVRRSKDGGKTWGPEILIWDDGGKSINNPCPVVDPKTGRIWICLGRWAPYPNASQHVAYSDDDGSTWSKPKDVTQTLRKQMKPGDKIFIPGPGAGIVMTRGKYAGRLVIPMGFEPHVVYSDDHGETWKMGGRGGNAMGEARCVELTDGSLLFNGRTGTKKRALSIVAEGGTKDSTETWHADDLPDPSCQGAVLRHSWPGDGKPGLILYSGPGVNSARARGTLFGSYDEGKTWPWKLEYYQGGSGYSDACVLPDGRVAILFEKDGKSHLGFTVLPAPPALPPRAATEKQPNKKAPSKADGAAQHEALLFLIAGDANAEGQAPFSKETNAAAGHEVHWPAMPGSTAVEIGLPVKREAYPNSFVWSLTKNRFEPLTPGANLLANLRRRGRPVRDPNRHGIELPLAHRLQQQFPGKDIFFVKVAEGGTALCRQWKPGTGAMYRKLVEACRKATADLTRRYATVNVLGLYWDQCEGEFDFNIGVAPMKAYPDHLPTFVKALRADTRQPALRIFMPKQMFHKIQTAWRPVVMAQQAFCKQDSNSVLIDIDRGRYGMNMKLWSWAHNWTTLSSKGYAAVADRITTELMLTARATTKLTDGSPNTKRPAIVFLIAGQSNAGGTATLTVAHRRAAGYQAVWPASPEIAGENCGIPVADAAYVNCFLAVNNSGFQPIAPATQLRKHQDAFATQGARKSEYRHGIELPAAHRLRRQFPNNDVYVIKVYGGGKNLHTHWNPDVRGQFFDLFIRTVPPALSTLAAKYPEVRVVGLYWDQGESDTGPEAVRYESVFRKLVARIRGARLPNLKVFARKHIFYHHVSGGPIVNKALAKVAAEDPNVHVLDIDLGAGADNEPNFDAWSCTFRNIHLGSKAFKELTRLIFDEVVPNAEVADFLRYKP